MASEIPALGHKKTTAPEANALPRCRPSVFEPERFGRRLFGRGRPPLLLGRLLAFQSSVRLRSFCLKVSRRFDKNRRLHLRRPQKGSLPIGFIPLIHFVYILTQSAEKAREISRLRLSAFWIKAGGSMWESNPPKRLLTAITGFEDQRAHQRPSTPILLEAVVIISHLPPFCKRLLVNSLSILLVLFIGFINSLAEIPFWRYTGSSVIPTQRAAASRRLPEKGGFHP
jgi:hypothetical protein